MRILHLGAVCLLSSQVVATALPERISNPYTTRIVPRSHILHERHLPDHTKLWTKRNRADPKTLLPVRVGLVQDNLGEGHRLLWDISDPNSPNYGNHLSPEEVLQFFAPSDDRAKAVTEWLVSEGISAPRISRSRNKQWIQFDATVEEIEALLYADFHIYEHKDTATLNVACTGYHLPESVRDHIDYITPGIRLMSEKGLGGSQQKRAYEWEVNPEDKTSRSRRRLESDALIKSRLPLAYKSSGQSLTGKSKGVASSEGTSQHQDDGRIQELQQEVEEPEIIPPYNDCIYSVTPECIRAQYDIPEGTKNRSDNKLGIFQGLNIRYWQGDLDRYFNAIAPWVPKGSHPQNNLVNGAIGETNNRSESGAEAVMDFQLGMSLVWPQETVLWHVDDPWYEEQHTKEPLIYKGYFNNLFNAIDGSYCDFAAYNQSGNCLDPECLDPTYPNSNPGGYDGPLACGTFEQTNIISISYSGSEASLPASYLRRQCAEIMKLSMQGVTVVVSSGDYGVGSNRRDPPPLGCLGENYDVFNPNFPGNCPYVLTVGSTEWRRVERGGDPPSEDDEDGEGDERVDRGGREGDDGRGEDEGRGGGNDDRGTKKPNRDQVQRFTGPYEEVATTFFSSGGGFSNVYPVPEYQLAHHKAYFSTLAVSNITLDVEGYHGGRTDYETIGSDGLKFNMEGRGYPDLSAIGDNIYVVHRGHPVLMMGTSASAPIVASMLNLVNEERLAAGKGTIGWIHPVIYSHPEIFEDIAKGANPNCLSGGFPAVKGWDPVTGLGTPKYPKLLEVFMSLP